MKKLLSGIFILLFAQAQFSRAQNAYNIECRVTDTEGNRVEFATAAVEGGTYGTISDAAGNMTLNLPGSLDSTDLVFSHISFDDLMVNIGELRARYMQAREPVTIQMTRRKVELPQAVVSAKIRRTVILKNSGLPLFGGISFSISRSNPLYDTLPGFKERANFGKMFHTDVPVLIKSLDFEAMAIIDSVVLRITVHRMEADSSLTPLSIEPVYVLMKKSHPRSIPYDIDMSAAQAYGSGDIYINVGIITRSVGEVGDQYDDYEQLYGNTIYFPMYTGKTFGESDPETGLFLGKLGAKYPVGPGVTVRGIRFK